MPSSQLVQILTIVGPVFAIVLGGWLTERLRYLPAGSAPIIAQFSFKVAMPVFLFRAMIGVKEMPEAPWRFVGAYFGSLALLWITAALVTRFILRRPAPDGAAIAMATCFGNGVMLGIPLAISAFGPAAAVPIALLVSLDTPLLWSAAMLHIEGARRSERPGPILGQVAAIALDLLRNPILIGLFVGVLFRYAGLTLPDSADRFTALLGQAAVPSGLFALGMSLAGYGIKGQIPTVTAICLLKLILFPIVVSVMAGPVLGLPPVWFSVAVLFAAMPVGANAFIFAAKYETAVGSVSAAIAVSTLIAILSVSVVLYLVGTP
jgi:predicted permease